MATRASKRRRRIDTGSCDDGGNKAAGSGGAAAVVPPIVETPEAEAGTGAEESVDYSSMEYWDRRYREGVDIEWYCGFDHVRPLFERFIAKVGASVE